MESLNLKSIFFEALNYPQYARPNFYLIKQRQSAWDKGVYLQTLAEVYYVCDSHLRMHYNANKKKNPTLKIETIQLPIKNVTSGEEKKNFNKKQIEELFLAIQYSFQYDKEEKEYSNVEILTFVEYALGFIRNEFREQISPTTKVSFRPHTKSYFIYLIAQDAPFFNFPKFKKAFRELLLSVRNVKILNEIMTHYYKASIEIVNMWNNSIHSIEEKSYSKENNIPPETIRIEFKGKELNHSWWNDVELFNIHSPELFRNQDLAGYAAKIATLLNSELNKSKDVGNLDIKEQVNLEDLFINKKEFSTCVDILRNLTPVVISPENHFLLGPRDKSVFAAWIDVLKHAGKLPHATRQTHSMLINKYFTGVNFGKDGKTFSNTHTPSYKKYYKMILSLLP
jgi:hypothetical protein